MDKNLEYKQIRALYNDKAVRVYQAYNNIIADEVIKLGHFGKSFKLERMTWIKPSFLWMMYRSGWATKVGQERILAIDIYRDKFDFILENAVSSNKGKLQLSENEWKTKIKLSNIRYQWDPERDLFGNPLNYRSIQLGLRGEIVRDYITNYIINIEDITSKVEQIFKLRKSKDIDSIIPDEIVYPVTPKAKLNLGMDK